MRGRDRQTHKCTHRALPPVKIFSSKMTVQKHFNSIRYTFINDEEIHQSTLEVYQYKILKNDFSYENNTVKQNLHKEYSIMHSNYTFFMVLISHAYT